MSVSKWAYDEQKCEGKFCVGDCDLCRERVEFDELEGELYEERD